MSKQDTLCCGDAQAKVHGRTLRLWLKDNRLKNKFGKFKDKQWVTVCPKCHADDLKVGEKYLPFFCADGVMRIIKDNSAVLDFCGFYFSLNALRSSTLEDSELTKEIETLGTNFKLDSISARKFSKKVVCDWGRGHRVWGNLIKDKKLSGKLNDWFVKVRNGTSDDFEAIEAGIKIKGLGISFASKHLRMLAPERFAVLDSVLSGGLGFALNTKGYLFFLRFLREFQNELQKSHSAHFNIATIESGIFNLVRQQFRVQ